MRLSKNFKALARKGEDMFAWERLWKQRTEGVGGGEGGDLKVVCVRMRRRRQLSGRAPEEVCVT